MTNHSEILRRWQLLSPYLNRRQRSLWAGAEAEAVGYGGCVLLSAVTGLLSSDYRDAESPGTGNQ
jgi:hypothetical protein